MIPRGIDDISRPVPFVLKEFLERKLEKSFVVVRGMDHPQSGDIRKRLTDEQRAYVKGAGRVKMIHGGLLYTSDDRIAGTFLILEAATSADVRNWVHTSPFHKKGLFATISIDRWGWIYGRLPSCECWKMRSASGKRQEF